MFYRGFEHLSSESRRMVQATHDIQKTKTDPVMELAWLVHIAYIANRTFNQDVTKGRAGTPAFARIKGFRELLTQMGDDLQAVYDEELTQATSARSHRSIEAMEERRHRMLAVMMRIFYVVLEQLDVTRRAAAAGDEQPPTLGSLFRSSLDAAQLDGTFTTRPKPTNLNPVQNDGDDVYPDFDNDDA